MKKILITAFKPFGDIIDNSSTRVLEGIKEFDNVIIYKEILDVVFDKFIYENLLIKYKPDILLLCGQAASRDKVTLEQIAINFVHTTIADNAGNNFSNDKIYQEGDDGYFNTIGASKIVSKLETNYPVKLSLSAGGYVCNYSFYTSLITAKRNDLNTKIGFIHFPLYSGQTTQAYPSLDLGLMIDILNNIIISLLEE